jgi:hypothetical protein
MTAAPTLTLVRIDGQRLLLSDGRRVRLPRGFVAQYREPDPAYGLPGRWRILPADRAHLLAFGFLVRVGVALRTINDGLRRYRRHFGARGATLIPER